MNLSDAEIEQLASKFKILSSKSRLKILNVLAAGELTVSEIIERTGMLQANVSKHLGLLSKNGIIKSRLEGRSRYYIVVDKTVLNICKIMCSNGD